MALSHPGILLLVLLLSAFSAFPAVSGYQDTPCPLQISDAEYQHLEAFYKDLHQYPELSGIEMNTSAKIADELRRAGFDVTDHVGGIRGGGSPQKRERPGDRAEG